MIGDIAALVRVVLAFGVGFVAIPWFALPRPLAARSKLDVVAINLVRWTAVVIVLSHVLAATNLYSALAMSLAFLAIAWFAKWRQRLGGYGGVLKRIWQQVTERGERERAEDSEGRSIRRLLLLLGLAAPILGLVGVVFYLRAESGLQYLSLSPPDAYVHMAWADAFQHNVLWPDGVYPLGMAAVVSYIDLMSPFTDIVHVARFTGPIVGTLLVLSIYYAVVRLTRNPGAALFAAGTIGLFGTRPEWREPWHRLIGLLPQEFGVAFVIIALTVAILGVTERTGEVLSTANGQKRPWWRDDNGLTLFAAGLAVGMTHPVPGAFMLPLIGLGAGTAALARRDGAIRRGIRLVGATFIGVVAGFAVVPLAELIGFRAYVDYGAGEALADVASGSNMAEFFEEFGELAGHTPFSIVAVACVVLGLVAAFTLYLVKKDRVLTAQLLGLTVASGFLVALYDFRPFAPYVDLFYLVRLANLLGAMLALAFGVGLGWLGALLGQRRLFAGIATLLAVGVAALAVFGWQFPAVAGDEAEVREQLVYEQAARAVLDIKAENPPLTYTIVGSPAERQMLAGEGYFVASWVFARDIGTVPEGDIVPIPTADTYIFIEKVPFPVREAESVNGPNEEYYFLRDKRGRIMAVMYDWVQNYSASHTQIDVYYEDEQFVVYRLRRNPAIAVDEDTPQFKDYTYRPGELFTEGPTVPDVEP